MMARDRGHVINITSIAAIYNFNGNSVYHATKAGVHALSRQLRVDCYGKRVRITEICPGRVATDIFGNVSGDHEDARKRLSMVLSCRKQKTLPIAWPLPLVPDGSQHRQY
jgi:NADP-dependent 3-hydroxy acid dehydrogenase YdfG